MSSERYAIAAVEGRGHLSRRGRTNAAANSQTAYPSRLEWVLALVALGFQLIVSGLHSPSLVSPSDEAELAGLFNAHALCVAADGSQPSSEAPADKVPTPPIHHLGACCPWHGNASPCVPTPATVEPITFGYAGITFSPLRPLLSRLAFPARPVPVPHP